MKILLTLIVALFSLAFFGLASEQSDEAVLGLIQNSFDREQLSASTKELLTRQSHQISEKEKKSICLAVINSGSHLKNEIGFVEYAKRRILAFDFESEHQFGDEFELGQLMDYLVSVSPDFSSDLLKEFEKTPVYKYKNDGSWDPRFIYKGLRGLISRAIYYSGDEKSMTELNGKLDDVDYDRDSKKSIIYGRGFYSDSESGKVDGKKMIADFAPTLRRSEGVLGRVNENLPLNSESSTPNIDSRPMEGSVSFDEVSNTSDSEVFKWAYVLVCVAVIAASGYWVLRRR